MNSKAAYIKQRLSLREPLREALDIVAELAEALSLEKNGDLDGALEIVSSRYPSCTDFERAFPSLCFSIATGVGKTRLMGACIAWLYLQKGIRNFFVLAPNLTIYEKLIEDFGNPNYSKYVFNGIAEFVYNRPVVITGDNYEQQGILFRDTEIRINIFNISKFNRDAAPASKGKEKGKPPRMKRLAEYLGHSYWSYLSGLNDLVILMDEAHRYHADASRNAINELKPVLGLELTATPTDEKGLPFRNIVYEYTLARALADGKYIKNPAIATRKNFQPKGLTDKEIEIIKLEDAVSLHWDTKTELEVYSRTNGVEKVKPFILVVCRDINHARETADYLRSASFFNGAFSDKVLQIDSSTRKDDEVERQFVELENADNDIEIVVHVNMLKEGWDVRNLYTIVPLRAANASILIEQTIGRGLRLPYNGERTGVDKIDKLTVVAHDNFDKVIAEAQNPESVLNKFTYIEIPEEELGAKTVAVTALPRVENEVQQETERIASIKDEGERRKATRSLDAKKAIINALPSFSAAEGVTSSADLLKPEVRQLVMQKVEHDLGQGQINLFAGEILVEAGIAYADTVASYRKNSIDIPRMDLVKGDVPVWFEDFDLDVTSGFDFRIMAEEIIRRNLKDNMVDTIGVQQGALGRETPKNQIVAEVLNYSTEVDYDSNADLLHKLARQALEKLESTLDDTTQLPTLVYQARKFIAANIGDQMKKHFRMGEPHYREPKVLPFVKIEQWDGSALALNGYKDYRDPVTPVNTIPKYVYRGFEKACHFEYKFDSKAEKELAFVLEHDIQVLKWLRPAPNQFRIYWQNNTKRYEPDFIVETAYSIYMIETKAANELDSREVLEKTAAALRYCSYATGFTTANNGKPWKYLLIPHDQVATTSSFEYLAGRFEMKC
ncbi:DEAD/DEAH box helicase [Pelodictyon phaeoclathratiforme]|jgi:type III restriction enzyme|uniref:Type III restriction protein res subunit n=1 Tax=Pelodictyon phaeoclathratiforme (strain DSM 5477 / BU-1) TaxID=324925 RepID=B4SCI6_PELPB|nr:DEAD/DEAH box helicase family protein [Pelodictyon phaeoclathratiforme]ACF44191.1 type III restriction protein res subunit [Pelodictyon phaeoclathratiforme BU-1]MBV5288558.1 DEAD/DEAH box helicase family protein [Pelodictyon phaeoclathratiforme]